ncbi:DUF3987 domain-containing protein [Salirhabdus sp. Marseille-P4669]|uniref:DUF3987 domain-containing protein n=1 Tax=Salirhabdus sp. Marseille-P4669 TaxID=2042310 RepID=UPI000C7D65A1|nr:DUF3987 domain-containing protein [Salirhabdus sp. Marseille-P4669]
MKYNLDDIKRTLNICTLEHQVYELRLFSVKGKGTISGYFDNMDKLAEVCAYWSGKCPGVYITLNPVNPALLGRANNKIIHFAKSTTNDNEILSLEWLYIDIDPVRPSGISSSNEEKEMAYTRARQVYKYLKDIGFPDCIVADSGNGYHLKYRIKLPNDTESRQLLNRFLSALDLKFSNEAVEIDTTTSNPSRISKVYGTMSCKGDHTKERPHRLNKILHVPEEFIGVDRELIESVANLLPRQAPHKYESSHKASYTINDVGEWLNQKGIKVKSVGQWQGGRKYLLDQCVWDPSHTDNSAIVVQFPDGKIIAMCQHNSCKGKGFKDFRDTVEPGWREHARKSINLPDDSEEATFVYSYPEPLEEYAFHGLAGDIVKAIEPHTEGDIAALLVNFLTLFGNIIGNQAHKLVEANEHPGRLFAVLVGDSSVGRKGTSWGHIKRLFEMADMGYVKNNVKSGLSSGEGLVYHVRDPIYKYKEKTKEDGEVIGEEVLEDEGVKDKRLLVVESEFASILKVAKREGNTITEVIRQMWDNGSVQTLTKNSPVKTTNAHVSILGHITKHELTKNLKSTEMANGFANRFLFICTRRSKLLAFGGNIEQVDFSPLIIQLNEAISFGRTVGRIEFDDESKKIWVNVYEPLTSPNNISPLINNIISRMAPQVLRIALIYAILDCSTKIKQPHLMAALSIAKYSIASCEYIFGNNVDESISDKVYRHIKQHRKEGLTRSELYDLFGRKVKSEELNPALASLIEKGVVYEHKEGKKKTYYPVK